MTFRHGHDGVPVTGYGAPATSVRDAAAVLRARAAKDGVRLLAAADIDLAAAVVGADAWTWLHDTDTLTTPAAHGPGAVASLAAVLARAAGHRTYVTGDVLDIHPVDIRPAAVERIEGYRRWLTDQVGETAVAAALRRAAADLAGGADVALTSRERTMVAFAALLDVTAGT